MNNNASAIDLRISIAATIAFTALIATILSLTLIQDPSGMDLRVSVTAFSVAILVALASIVGGSSRNR